MTPTVFCRNSVQRQSAVMSLSPLPASCGVDGSQPAIQRTSLCDTEWRGESGRVLKLPGRSFRALMLIATLPAGIMLLLCCPGRSSALSFVARVSVHSTTMTLEENFVPRNNPRPSMTGDGATTGEKVCIIFVFLHFTRNQLGFPPCFNILRLNATRSRSTDWLGPGDRNDSYFLLHLLLLPFLFSVEIARVYSVIFAYLISCG